MNEELRKTCDEFLNNQLIFKEAFPFSYTRAIGAVASYYFMSQNVEANEEMLKLCRKIIRQYSGLFSSFRGNGELIYTSMLASDDDPGNKMSLALAAYDALKIYFRQTPYLTFLAMMMVDQVSPSSYHLIAGLTNTSYSLMKERHLFLTSDEDVPYAGLFAMSQKSTKGLVEESEQIYTALKSNFSIFSNNARQSVSHALALCSGDAMTKCEKLLRLYDLAYENKLRYGHSFELVALGVLANLGIDHTKLVEDLLDVAYYLKAHYPLFSGARRRYHAIMVCAAHYMSANVELTSAIVIATLLEIQQQQAAAAAAT